MEKFVSLFLYFYSQFAIAEVESGSLDLPIVFQRLLKHIGRGKCLECSTWIASFHGYVFFLSHLHGEKG